MNEVRGPVDAILYDYETDLDQYRGLTDEEADKIEHAARLRAHNGLVGQDGRLVLVGLYLGLRRSEIARIKWEDISGGWVTIRGKGRRKRKLPVHPRLVEVLPTGDEGWMFLGQSGHIADSTVYTGVNA